MKPVTDPALRHAVPEPEAGAAAVHGWRARLDPRRLRLRTKLFLAIAGANAVLALAAYLVFSWSFDRGFAEQLRRADTARIAALAAQLAQGYGVEGSWDWIARDRIRWDNMTRDALGLPRRSPVPPPPGSSIDDDPPPAPVPQSAAAPPRDLPLVIDPRLVLLDAQRVVVAGRAKAVPDAVFKPVVWQAQTVGFLGYLPRPEREAAFERAFSRQQSLKFAAIALVMLLASLLLGAGLAQWLTRRVRTLERGTRALIQGDYAVRLESGGEDEIAWLARDFNRLAVTLGEARNARQQWIADIAHELRTPLAVLRGEIEALQDGVRVLGPGSLDSLAQEVARLGRLIEDLHLLSLSDLGGLSYVKEDMDPADLLDELLAVQRRALEERGILAVADLQRGARVLGDATRLAQVFGNLMQNTLRYTDAPGRLEITLRADGGRVEIDWRDSSPGVCDADLARLTDRLFRVENSRSRAGGGSGLGLAIARAIVEAHEGTLTAYHSPLGGLGWRLSLPAIAEGGRG
ncbi:MAG: HAMP domain-containing protein [Betaproteobacteria bacterium]|nr:HAMP domain-containing protein [Betaproteobacteria bacterium]